MVWSMGRIVPCALPTMYHMLLNVFGWSTALCAAV